MCGPGSFRAIEILFLDGGETGLSIDALSSCVSARITSPAISSQEAPTSSDDELRVPVASRRDSVLTHDQHGSCSAAADHRG